MDRYVCAFRGRRDDYQVAAALAENDRLEKLVTDVYAGRTVRSVAKLFPQRVREATLFRYSPRIPDDRVECLWGTTAVEYARHWLGKPRAATYAALDGRYSHRAMQLARRTRSNLLLYTPYAYEAFIAQYPHHPKRWLFQYHPHALYEERILRQDAQAWPEIADSFSQEVGTGLSSRLKDRVESVWQHADGIFCASTFTRRTLIEAGAEPARCVVACYGVDAREAPAEEKPPRDGFHVVFVGSGVQRKGLHHLLRAWEMAKLPRESSLTLVCRVLDPGLRHRVRGAAGVRLLPGVSRLELDTLYRDSSLFAMPSLVEGFGQVYLEALGAGCPVLGTANTCLPDLGDENDGIFLAEIGSVEQLTQRLEQLAAFLPGRPDLRTRASNCARAFTWERFRAKIVSEL